MPAFRLMQETKAQQNLQQLIFDWIDMVELRNPFEKRVGADVIEYLWKL